MGFYPQNRRGISTIVGALFFTVLMVAGFSVMSLALDAQTDIVTTQRVISDIVLKKQQERFGIAVSTDASNFLDISVSNTGQNPIGISSFWIINKTLVDAPATRYEIDYDNSFVTGGSTTQILTSQTLSMIPDTYDIKVVSTLGTIEITELDVSAGGSSSNSLRSVMVTDPPDVILGQNVTIGMIVTNTGQLPISDVSPLLPTANPSGAVTESSGPNLPSVDLIPGESFLFLWDYTIDGTADDPVDFSNFATGIDQNNNLVQSNIATDTSILREDSEGEGGGGGGGEEIVIKHELFAKPEIFMTLPNLVATKGSDSDSRPIWGIMVANPTDQDMYVNKVVISSTSPRDTADDIVFKEGCSGESGFLSSSAISPTTNSWSCPASNQVVWKNTSTPQLIEPRSVFPFLVAIGSEAIGSTTADSVNVLIQPVVFTTLGQFSTAAYGTTVFSDESSTANVFLTRDPESVDYSDIMGEKRAITEGTTETFYATIADMSDDNSYGIESGTELIINIPKDWTLTEPICPTCHDGFNTPIINTFQDGSKQIVGELNASIQNHNQAKSIEFSATAPLVSSTKMYIMHILAYGTATGKDNGDLNVGPVSEAVLQVCPTSGCIP